MRLTVMLALLVGCGGPSVGLACHADSECQPLVPPGGTPFVGGTCEQQQ